MKVFLKIVAIFLFLHSAPSLSKSGAWIVPPKIVSVQNNGWLQYWVGDGIEVYRDSDGTYKRIKVTITHITDKSNYRCGQVVSLSLDDVQEASGSSFQLYKC